MNYEPFTSIENPILAHFRHFRHFSSLFTLSPLYICREFSTNQLLFMQNKPNLVRRRRIANSVCTMNYKNFIPLAGQKNKPNSNPIKPNLRKAKMNVNLTITKDYRKKDDFLVRINKPNSKPISSKAKMNVNLYVIEDYENETTLRPQKNKPNSNPISKQLVWAGPRRAESAKMARKIDVLEHQNITLKNSNFLYPNRLNSLSQHNPPTGTSFAHSYRCELCVLSVVQKASAIRTTIYAIRYLRKEYNYG